MKDLCMNPFPTHAMVLAAGLGTRMRPLTLTRPKPLIEVAGQTLLDRVLGWMENAGVKDMVVNTHYLARQIEDHVRHYKNIQVSSEADALLETGGGIAKALPLLGPAPFFSANSDTICLDGKTPALHRMAAAWNDDEMDALLLLHPTEKAIGYEGRGDFAINPDGTLTRRGDAPSAPYVFTGVQLLHPRLFAGHPAGPFSMNILYDRAGPRLRAIAHDGDWLHVGDPEGLALAEAWLKANR